MIIKHYFILIAIFYSVNIYSQNSEVIIDNLKPAINENKFPLIKYKKNTKVEDKINTLLQIENLEHLPNVFKKNPFEKVVYGQERSNGSVQFYDYKKNKTPKNILSLMINGEATGAYSEEFEMYYNFDLRTGKKLNLKDFITENGIKEITKKLNKNVKKIIELFSVSIKNSLKVKSKNLSDEDFSNEQIELYSACIENIEENTIEYYDYYFEKDSITFVRGRCSNHAMRAIDDLDKFKIKFSYNEIKKYFTKYGLSLLNGETNVLEIKSPEGKFYKGKINNKYPITLLLLEIYSDNSLNIQYWYDKNRIPIEWNGNFINNHFSLIEYDHYDEEKQKWLIQAKIEANLINDKIIGTWTNVKTNEIFKIELTEY